MTGGCYAESRYAECHYAYGDCHHAECRYAECHGAHVRCSTRVGSSLVHKH